MKLAQYLACDATDLAHAVARGEATPQQLLGLALDQQARVQARFNPVCRAMEPQARAQLQRPLAGPFAGVPFLLKDILQDYAGVPTGSGSRAGRHYVPQQHAAVVRRYLAGGLVIFGKTNVPELGLKAVTDPQAHGRTSNPWDGRLTAGGSSGGAAAAVAAGIVPMAAANDGGGSIRIPASYCGLFGLRPSRGRVSCGPAQGEVWFGASSEGVISRSVRDTARALDLLSGPEPGDPFVVAAPQRPFQNLMLDDPGRLRVAFSTASPIGTPVDAEAVAAVQQTAQLLQDLGHDVEAAEPRIDGRVLAASFVEMYFGQVAAALETARAMGAHAGEFEVLTRVLGALGRANSAASVVRILALWNDFARALGYFFERYDVYLTPTVAGPAVPHGRGDPAPGELALLDLLERSGVLRLLARLGVLGSTIDRMARDSLQHVPFTQLANLTGTPAMSVPLHWTAAGLPMGVQFGAAFGQEALLLQLARQLELARPWFDRRPAWLQEAAAAAR